MLVVDDDRTVCGVLVEYLGAAGLDAEACGDGETALALAQRLHPDLVILDLMLPRLDGFEVFRRLRLSGVAAPVIMLTARGEEADRVLGLEMGADDYVAKPFSPRELVLRVRSVLRRSAGEPDQPAPPGQREVLRDGDLVVDPAARRAELAGRPLHLTLREFDLLAHFVTHPDLVMSRDELMSAVWGWEVGDSSTVTVHVRRLRGKIEADPDRPTRIVTVWGRGYRWQPATSSDGDAGEHR